MFGAIYIGLSGLNAYSRGLQLVSNNVANLNSSGFKSTEVSFTDLIGMGTRGQPSGAGQAASGQGVNIDENRRDFGQGELRQTNRDLDLAVDGNGFLLLMRGDERLYTRTGSFEVDPQGYIVLAGTDYRLATLDETGRPTSISIDSIRTNPPQATTRITLQGNLSSTAGTGGTGPTGDASVPLNPIHVFDASGTEHVWTVTFARKSTDPADQWSVSITDNAGGTIGTQTMKFISSRPDPASMSLTFLDDDADLSVTLDLSQNVTSFSSGQLSTLQAAPDGVDGFGVGTFVSVLVNDSGNLEISYSNEQKKSLGTVALADFRDPQKLEERSGGLYVETGPSDAQLFGSADLRVGRVVSRQLEASNVDLAQQFGDLIMIQRGFQASSQIISVSNDMIQQLFGIRGQG